MFKAPLLQAYPYMSKEIVDILNVNQHQTRFVLDSGAFTAWKAGKTVNLDEYCRFIETLPFKPWRYFTLDVVGDPAKTLSNYETMLKRGFKPVPIFTRGEDISVLEEYYKTSDVVGIGGLVGTEGNKGFVKGIMTKVGNRKVHWLGFTSHPFIVHYKPHMCDSSAWNSGAMYGTLCVYLGNGRFELYDYPKFMKKKNDKLLFARIAQLKVDPYKLLDRDNWFRGTAIPPRVNAASYFRYSRDVLERFETNLFLVINVSHYAKILYKSFGEL